MHIAAGRTDVVLSRGRCADARSVVLRECISIFNEYVAANELRVFFYIDYPSYLSHQWQDMNRTLGLHPMDPPEWAGETVGEDMVDPDLDEVTAGIHLTES